ncbi:siderophore-interacting protein [Nesterenkonia sp. HG001]|uniref:siderophore-interacting protein n=1 Tax=Nesterenkonia sp. HG001 TaxID=2983207 RepID=UPI002AC44F4E|nr:siderophore-interacting protein [Nesterenkonia sp. HG001]MDZ5076625.1 siderophore-interacting protein [Nesterenkonia sp. HG001]
MDRTAPGTREAPPPRFAESPNRLFLTRVHGTTRLSPGFLRITLRSESLRRFAPLGLDHRFKILLPSEDDGFAPELAEDLLPESRWRRRWRDLPARRRPLLRSYTVSAARPTAGELDVDVHLHAHPGPAARWASLARPGDALVISGAEASQNRLERCVQWTPGGARRAWIGGDESAAPAILGILAGLSRPHAHDDASAPHRHLGTLEVTVTAEAEDPEDAAWIRSCLQAHTETLPGASFEVICRPDAARGEALHRSAARWLTRELGPDGASGAAVGPPDIADLYAWAATESSQVAALKRRLRLAGLPAAQIQAQAYWTQRPSRPSLQPSPESGFPYPAGFPYPLPRHRTEA